MNKVRIVVTSYREKGDRIFQGDEWCDGWRFSDHENLRIRKKSTGRSEEVKSLSELPQRTTEDAIIWIRGKELAEFPKDLADVIRKLRETKEVFVSYHDEFVGRQIADKLSSWDRMMPYSLSSGVNPGRFQAIIKMDRRGEHYLDSEASFDDLFRFFFLKPTDVIPLVLHKLMGVLSVIDMDLQYFEDKGFTDNAWKQLVISYKGGHATEKLNECRSVLYENPLSLKRLYEGETAWLPSETSTILQNRWEHLTELFPEKEKVSPGAAVNDDSPYVEVQKVIKGLDNENKAAVEKNFEGGNSFRKWMNSLEQAVNAIKEVVMTTKSEPVSV
jgi:hypothetical protein